jgi:D-alanyl-D-alanine carboxypeptidase/D-alanyl-D-alanine-endopeptidase (penicillin-binding protein 4)
LDGSGLSRYNLISPQDFVFVLEKMKNEFDWKRITTILPTGNDGTLSGYYKNYAGKIYAKTGTLSNNVSLSGYIITNKGKQLIFSVQVNNHQTSATAIRRAVEKFLTTIIDQY